MKKSVLIVILLSLGVFKVYSQSKIKSNTVNYTTINGLERDSNGYIRRDNSDIIKVDGLYYVWYSKMRQFVPNLPVASTIWYATSPDGFTWTEKGECIATGKKGSWDDDFVFTPGILVANDKYYLFYTAISTVKSENGLTSQDTAIGAAVSDSPNGPWEKLPSNPILLPSEDRNDFDSHRIDDSCLIVRDGKFWLYYKGRQWGKAPTETKMGVAIAENPEGPYIKHKENPLVEGSHEVLVWPQGTGVGTMVGMKLKGKKSIPFYQMYAKDGIHFKKTYQIDNDNAPWAPGAYRPEAFTDSDKGQIIKWGLHIGGARPNLFLERFDITN
ncbi:family 43 glycosylhydrolase [Tamlana sp. 62-3]|uniref:Family 43 glycosylhydrolase n=1 Tax=Neotamlana sargassicola TaxID=2883125 RepID=A0A9X1I4U0_9FLAO|nr:family 43 glycosylhydrolase [Tamlana sargassicola]MCB4807866.1 family 43 glycosylhydrolase [Tamlana sargassicola]